MGQGGKTSLNIVKIDRMEGYLHYNKMLRLLKHFVGFDQKRRLDLKREDQFQKEREAQHFVSEKEGSRAESQSDES